ncbi:MAG: glycosyltransferase family 4 protein [Planctomycetota bacterium]|nr:glycosyltransferase family 4 protein [Planctomycetota bacterium]
MVERPERRLRVLHCNTQWRLRGGEEQTITLAERLIRQGHGSRLVCQPESPVAAAARERGVPVTPLRMRADADPFAVASLLKVLRKGRYDIVHAHTSHAVGLLALSAPFGGWPARVHTRRIARSVRRPGALGMNRWKYLLGTDACIGISRAVVRQLGEDGLPEDRLALVPSGVDLPTHETHLHRADLGLPPRGLIIGIVAHLEEEKGVDILLDAFARIGRSQPSSTLLIVGDGPDRQALQDRSRDLGLDGRVRFLGLRQDVGSILPLMDVYASASRREALGTSILAAQAHGLPVAATRVGGVAEVVADGRTGLLVPTDDPESLAAALDRLGGDRSLRRRLGQAGRARVAERFSTDRMVAGTLEVYRKVLAGRGRQNGPR